MIAVAEPKRRAYHHGDLRRALLRAGLDLLDREGPAFSLRHLAREADVSHNAPYRHFADKETLLVQLAVLCFHDLSAELDRAAAEAPTPLSGLLAVATAYLDHALDHPNRHRLMFGLDAEASRAAEITEAGLQTFGRVTSLVRDCAAQGLLKPEDPEDTARTAWAMTHGLAQLALDGHFLALERDALRALMHRSAVRLLRGIGIGLPVVPAQSAPPPNDERSGPAAPSDGLPHGADDV